MPQPAALWPSPRNVLRQRLAIFSNEYMYYQILIATHLPTPRTERISCSPRTPFSVLEENGEQGIAFDVRRKFTKTKRRPRSACRQVTIESCRRKAQNLPSQLIM